MTRYLLQYEDRARSVPEGFELGDIRDVHVRSTRMGITVTLGNQGNSLLDAFRSSLEKLTDAYGIDALRNLSLKTVSDDGNSRKPQKWEQNDYQKALEQFLPKS